MYFSSGNLFLSGFQQKPNLFTVPSNHALHQCQLFLAYANIVALCLDECRVSVTSPYQVHIPRQGQLSPTVC